MAIDLLHDLKKICKDQKIGQENLYTPTYKTGLDILDYRNGKMVDGKPVVGIDGGKMFAIVGNSGVGKSSIALQMAVNIIKEYENGSIIYFDFERSMNLGRIQALTKYTNEEINKNVLLLNQGLSSESLWKLLKALEAQKLEKDNYKDIKIDSGKFDDEGNTIWELPPTVIIVDSIATMIPKTQLDDEEVTGSMGAASVAKINNQIFKKCPGILESANITLISINHITQAIDIGVIKKQAKVNYLKQDESLPGGRSGTYLASYILRLTASSKLEDDKEFFIKGFRVIGEFIKNRSNEAGRKFDMVFSQATGYDNILTNYSNIKKAGFIKGAGRGMYLESLPTKKFTQKKYREMYLTDKEFREAVDKITLDLYSTYIPKTLDNSIKEESTNLEEVTLETKKEENKLTLGKCIDEEQDIWEGSDGLLYTSDFTLVEYEEEEYEEE